MVYNKDFIKIVLIKLLDLYVKWKDNERGNYTRFFNLAMALLQKKDNEQLRQRVDKIERKYYLNLSGLENAIFKMKVNPLFRDTIIEIKQLNGWGEGWHRKIKININVFSAEGELNVLMRWTWLKLHELATRNNIDFTANPEYESLFNSLATA